jgi:hypothetical protein
MSVPGVNGREMKNQLLLDLKQPGLVNSTAMIIATLFFNRQNQQQE